jgi:hypothetical protein
MSSWKKSNTYVCPAAWRADLPAKALGSAVISYVCLSTHVTVDKYKQRLMVKVGLEVGGGHPPNCTPHTSNMRLPVRDPAGRRREVLSPGHSTGKGPATLD